MKPLVFWKKKKPPIDYQKFVNELFNQIYVMVHESSKIIAERNPDNPEIRSKMEYWIFYSIIACASSSLYANSLQIEDRLEEALFYLKQRVDHWDNQGSEGMDNIAEYVHSITSRTVPDFNVYVEAVAAWLYINVRDETVIDIEKTRPYMTMANMASSYNSWLDEYVFR
ncbi:hypothetical protein [Cohnella terricola]|uniref:Uncharacterized protein n=1 Tax=Cohnella terricola TaxID=1289167 RepID=A0A559JGS2_9BACL|nr:hypothetical protein [Cohnella terricola]TVX99069.1 hypothetical protein FPZ45_14040 [Cohnella terricola]